MVKRISRNSLEMSVDYLRGKFFSFPWQITPRMRLIVPSYPREFLSGPCLMNFNIPCQFPVRADRYVSNATNCINVPVIQIPVRSTRILTIIYEANICKALQPVSYRTGVKIKRSIDSRARLSLVISLNKRDVTTRY